MSKALFKSGMIVSAMTLISRVLGLVRDVVIANLMGAGTSADVFFFANKIPNFLRLSKSPNFLRLGKNCARQRAEIFLAFYDCMLMYI